MRGSTHRTGSTPPWTSYVADQATAGMPRCDTTELSRQVFGRRNRPSMGQGAPQSEPGVVGPLNWLWVQHRDVDFSEVLLTNFYLCFGSTLFLAWSLCGTVVARFATNSA